MWWWMSARLGGDHFTINTDIKWLYCTSEINVRCQLNLNLKKNPIKLLLISLEILEFVSVLLPYQISPMKANAF